MKKKKRRKRHRMGRREVLCPLIAARYHLFLSKHLYFVLYHIILYTIHICKTPPLPLQQTPPTATHALHNYTLGTQGAEKANNRLLFSTTSSFVALHNCQAPNKQRPTATTQAQFEAPQHWGGTKCKWGNEKVCKKQRIPAAAFERNHMHVVISGFALMGKKHHTWLFSMSSVFITMKMDKCGQ